MHAPPRRARRCGRRRRWAGRRTRSRPLEQRALFVEHPEVVELGVSTATAEDVQPPVGQAGRAVEEARRRRDFEHVGARRRARRRERRARLERLPPEEAAAPAATALGGCHAREQALVAAELGEQQRAPQHVLRGDAVQAVARVQEAPERASVDEAEDVQHHIILHVGEPAAELNAPALLRAARRVPRRAWAATTRSRRRGAARGRRRAAATNLEGWDLIRHLHTLSYEELPCTCNHHVSRQRASWSKRAPRADRRSARAHEARSAVHLESGSLARRSERSRGCLRPSLLLGPLC